MAVHTKPSKPAKPDKVSKPDAAKGKVVADASHGHNAPQPAGDSTRFDYMFEDLKEIWPIAHLPIDNPDEVAAKLKALGDAMVEDALPTPDPLTQPDNSVIPPVYTYWGQFIDHDMTLNTDGDSPGISNITQPPFVPREPEFVAANLKNGRHPALNLDSVYGDGPTLNPSSPTSAADMYDGIKFKLGEIAQKPIDPAGKINGVRVVKQTDSAHDLPRDPVTSKAIIGDGRNDENLVIAQLHVAFLRFHNAIVDWVKANEPQHNTDAKRFRRARQLAQFHYQWLVIHDFLDTIAINGMADKVLNSDAHVFDPDGDDVFMPLEYSVAAYRFGHSMVRGAYDYNRNFGRPGTHFQPNASFQLLFRFTGKSPQPFFGATKTLPFNWIIEWDRFIDKGSSTKDHFARKIDTQLALPLRTMDNEGQPTGNPPQELPPIVKAILKSLPARNLLRGYSLGIPTGQQIAAVLGIEPLTPEELQRGNNQTLHDALEAGNFHLDTPLWYYVLKEAEVRANGNSLGELGSRIVCETIIGQIRVDPHSYLNHQGGWSPQKGVKLANGDPIVTIGDLLEFAGVMTTLPEGTDDP